MAPLRTVLRPPSWRGSLGIFLALTCLVVGVLAAWNAQALFVIPLHEAGDPGLNALAIDHAREFREIYGNYSRWGFHHPGPAFFYVYAFGEWLFHGLLGVVPEPYNAQHLVGLILLAAFFGAALTMAARHVRARLFLPLALILATAHFAAVGASVFLSCWPPHVLLLTFVCFLVAAASVAAGAGEHLPWLVLAGGFLVHGHVAQPLFVVPIFLLACAGLWAGPPAPPAVAGGGDGETPRGRGPLAAWRSFPRAHRCALAVLAVFLLPLALDVARGPESNLAAILAHLRTHASDHKPFVRSLLYFTHFAAYTEYQPGREDFGRYSAAGAWAFYRAHAAIYALWLAGLAGAAGLAWADRRRRRRTGSPSGAADDRAPRRFIRWLGVMVGVSILLTLYWGHLQDGPMFYWNAWFNHGIYYAALLVLAALAAHALEPLLERAGKGATAGAFALCALVLAGQGWRQRHRFEGMDGGDAGTQQFIANTRRILRTQQEENGALAERGREKVLLFPAADWGVAAGVAVQLERAGQRFRVPGASAYMFGQHNAISVDWMESFREPTRQAPSIWRILNVGAAAPAADAPGVPLIGPMRLAINEVPRLDPADPAANTLDFTGQGNFTAYALGGWSTPGPGDTFSFNDARAGLLVFPTAPVPAGATVELSLEVAAFPGPTPGSTQILELWFNGRCLLNARPDPGVATARTPWRVAIPAATWNSRRDASLLVRFPEAVPHPPASPGDPRPLAFGFRRGVFRLTTP